MEKCDVAAASATGARGRRARARRRAISMVRARDQRSRARSTRRARRGDARRRARRIARVDARRPENPKPPQQFTKNKTGIRSARPRARGNGTHRRLSLALVLVLRRHCACVRRVFRGQESVRRRIVRDRGARRSFPANQHRAVENECIFVTGRKPRGEPASLTVSRRFPRTAFVGGFSSLGHAKRRFKGDSEIESANHDRISRCQSGTKVRSLPFADCPRGAAPGARPGERRGSHLIAREEWPPCP